MEHKNKMPPGDVAHGMAKSLEKQCTENGFPGGVNQPLPDVIGNAVSDIIANPKHKQR